MARRAGCGVAAKGGVINGCYAAYTTSVTFGDSFSSRRSLCACCTINNFLPYQFFCVEVNIFFFQFFPGKGGGQFRGGDGFISLQQAGGVSQAAQKLLR